MRGLLLVLGACSAARSELVIDRVEPSSGPSTSATAVRVEGEGFYLPIQSDLDDGTAVLGGVIVDIGAPLGDAVWRSERLLEATVPAGLAPGTYDVVVDLGDRDGVLPGGYRVTDDGVIATAHRRLIDITDAEVIGTHAEFPLLFATSAPWLRSSAAGGDVANPSGYDIVFSLDQAGTMRLAHEVELYRGDVGDLVAWVKLPTLSPTTVLYIHYGDPAITASQEQVAAVWSGGFAGVWHLLADLRDSLGTSPGGDGGTVADAGRIAAARRFDGIDDFVTVGSASEIDDVFAGGGTVEAWIYPTGLGESSRGRLYEKADGSTGNVTAGWSLSVDNVNVTRSILFGRAWTTRDGYWNSPASSLALDGWSHVAVVYDQDAVGNVPQIYINGQAVAVGTTSSPAGAPETDANFELRIGNRIAGDRTFFGTIDEPRLSRVARSAGFIATSYRNQFAPAMFYTIGPPL